jgi:hypothetical protein
MGDNGMSESSDQLSVSQSPAETVADPPLTFDERWARWQEKGARHDARVGRNMRLMGAIAVTMGVIWASMSLR